MFEIDTKKALDGIVARSRTSSKETNDDDSIPERPGWKQWATLISVALGIVLGILAWEYWQVERELSSIEAVLEDGDANEAFTLAEQFLREHPGDTRALAIQARALVAHGRAPEAIRLYEQIGVATSKDIHSLARAFMMTQQWGSAVPLLVRVTDEESDNGEALYELTACRMKLGRYEEALESATALSSLPDGTADGTLQLATIQTELKNHEEAARSFDRLLKDNPKLTGLVVPAAGILSEYGGTLVTLGRPKDAIPVLKRSLDVAPSAKGWQLLGQAYVHVGQDAQAIECWQKAVELDSTQIRARESLADAALQADEAVEALAWLEPLAASRDLKSTTTFLLQRVHNRLGNQGDAETWRVRTAELRRLEQVRAAVDNVLVESPDSFWARVVRARQFAEQGNRDQAAAMIEVLTTQEPDNEYVKRLSEAVRKRTTLPPLEDLPLTLH